MTTTNEDQPIFEPPTEVADPAPAELTKEQRAEITKKAYVKATTWLREEHRVEFNQKVAEEATAMGVPDWKPRPTAEDRERERLAELLAKYPNATPYERGVPVTNPPEVTREFIS